MRRRRSKTLQTEETLQLEDVLESPEAQQWTKTNEYPMVEEEQPFEEESFETYAEEYQDFYSEEYSEEHEAADMETRFHIAMGLVDLIGIIIGLAVILVLAGMLLTLFNWLKTDILHSALLLQSGLQ